MYGHYRREHQQMKGQMINGWMDREMNGQRYKWMNIKQDKIPVEHVVQFLLYHYY